jgi:hypothetical protein
MNNGKRYGDIYLLGCDGIYNQKSDLWVSENVVFPKLHFYRQNGENSG